MSQGSTAYSVDMVQREVNVAVQRVTNYWSERDLTEREIAVRIVRHLANIYAIDIGSQA